MAVKAGHSKNDETLLDAFEMKRLRDSAGFMDSKENE